MLCLLVLLCALLASNEAAHAWVHGDSEAHGDTCAVCLFAAGGVGNSAIEPLIAVAFLGRVIHTITPPLPRLSSGCPQAPDGRAPPAGPA
jgi:hypothetical protein